MQTRSTISAEKITVVLTSCGRWDLLTRSIDSFLTHHEPARFILIDDSGNPEIVDRIRHRFPFVDLIANEQRIGQHAAIDKAYSKVRTPFIVHLEDDWDFSGTMRTDEAIQLLSDDASVSAVCFVVFHELKLRHRIHSFKFMYGGQAYARMTRRAHRDWHGYSFYPTLVARATWEEYGPYANFPNERALSRYVKDRGRSLVYQLPGVAKHAGSGQSVFDPARAQERRRISGGLWRRLRGENVYRS